MKRYFDKISSYINGVGFPTLLFLFFIFLVPFKARWEFATEYSYLDGRFIDYLTISFYVFEVFLILSILFWIIPAGLKRNKINFGDKNIFVAIVLILFSSFISLFFSSSIEISIYYIFVLLGLAFTYLFIVNNFSKNTDRIALLKVFVFAMFIQSVLAIIQFAKNESLGFGLLGESSISPIINGVAKTMIGGVKHIRSYGTFPHPNLLGIYLVVGGIINIFLYSIERIRIYKVFLFISLAFISIALFLTFSRIAWLIALLLWLFYLLKIFKLRSLRSRLTKSQKILILISLLFCLAAFLLYFFPAILWRINPILDTTWASWHDRFVVIQKSLTLFKDNWWGVGIGGFIIKIAKLLIGYPIWMVEPVHNTFLLILVELGVIGLLSFVYLIYSTFKTFNKIPLYLKLIFLSLFVFMFFDHSFWDIRQVQYILFIFIGLISLYSIEKVA